MQEHADKDQTDLAIDVAGKRVVVIGGGNMAVDAARSAIRMGAREVHCAYRRSEACMTCSHHDYAAAQEEGVKFLLQASPASIQSNQDGGVTGVELDRTELGEPDATGRRPFSLLPGRRFVIAADVVLLALGFEPVPLPDEHPFNSVAKTATGAIVVDGEQRTSVPGLFAGGDLVHGPTTVLKVVRDARRAADGIEKFVLKTCKTTQPST